MGPTVGASVGTEVGAAVGDSVGLGVGTGVGVPVTLVVTISVVAGSLTMMDETSAAMLRGATSANSPVAFTALSCNTSCALSVVGVTAWNVADSAKAATVSTTEIDVSNSTAEVDCSCLLLTCALARRRRALRMFETITLPATVSASAATARRYACCTPAVNVDAEKPESVVGTTTATEATANVGCGVG